MVVKRIVPDIAASSLKEAKAFYSDLLGLDLVMDQGWIMTFASKGEMVSPQISIATEGGSGSPVPDLSIEVDTIDEVYEKARIAGYEITYPIKDEPWKVRRFFVRDPFGKTINIMSHIS